MQDSNEPFSFLDITPIVDVRRHFSCKVRQVTAEWSNYTTVCMTLHQQAAAAHTLAGLIYRSYMCCM